MKQGVTVVISLLCVAVLAAGLLFYTGSRDLPVNDDGEAGRITPIESNNRLIESNDTSLRAPPEIQPESESPSDKQSSRDPLVEFMFLLDAAQEQGFSQLAGFYENMEEGPEKYAAFFLLLKTWAKSDPDGAMGYALSVKVKERDRAKLYRDIYGDWASSDPSGFAASVLNETNPELREAKSTAVVMLMSEESPFQVVPVIEAEKDTRHGEDLLEMWLDTVARHQPESLLSCVNAVTDFDVRQSAAAIAIRELSRREPELAGLNYSSLSYESDLRTAVLPDILKGFYRNPEIDTVLMEQWMHSNLYTQMEQDVAAAALAELVMEADMDASIQWLDSIQDENIYQETLAALEKKYARKIKPVQPNP